MTEDLEFSISQYLDGTLSVADRSVLEQRLEQDVDAKAMFREYQRLDGVIKAAPMPDVAWDVLAASISCAVDRSRVVERKPISKNATDPYQMPHWIRTLVLPLSLAASVVVAVGIGFHLYGQRSAVPHIQQAAISQTSSQTSSGIAGPVGDRLPLTVSSSAVIIVTGPHAEVSAGPLETRVSIGPSDAVKDEPILVRYSKDLNSLPSHVAVASGVVPEHETEALPADMQ